MYLVDISQNSDKEIVHVISSVNNNDVSNSWLNNKMTDKNK